jgi:hypothetical protein
MSWLRKVTTLPPAQPGPQLSADEEERITRASYNAAYRLWWDYEKKNHSSVLFGPDVIFGQRSDSEGERLAAELQRKRLLWHAAQETFAATKTH